MLSFCRKRVIMIWGCILSLLLGAFIYALFREDTYIAKIILSSMDLTSIKRFLSCFDKDFIKYYLPDYLWAFSLCCGILALLDPKDRKKTFYCSFIAFSWGVIYEILQLTGIISGTGDIIDIILYFLAILTVNIIYLRSCGHEKNF